MVETREDSRAFNLLSIVVVSVGVMSAANSLVLNESAGKVDHCCGSASLMSVCSARVHVHVSVGRGELI